MYSATQLSVCRDCFCVFVAVLKTNKWTSLSCGKLARFSNGNLFSLKSAKTESYQCPGHRGTDSSKEGGMDSWNSPGKEDFEMTVFVFRRFLLSLIQKFQIAYYHTFDLQRYIFQSKIKLYYFRFVVKIMQLDILHRHAYRQLNRK